ncbi:PREDICTED: uncharacterized protein LOC104810555 [Tarenaya hassleriana]|uniref:uncharacterized protein LOC104810555 n=1 Tax=Tarenaya hassleriana TaxID=28532 RepID=UPI00053CA723|nr:PREDICTED: uncharacterized protein LOC104810555 [Tarenaya hassleriana]
MEEGNKEKLASVPNLRSNNHSRVFFSIRVLQVFLLFLVLALGISILSMNMIKYLRIQHLAPIAPTTFITFYDESVSLESFVRPPFNLRHSMNDSELLWRASLEPRIKNYPFKRVPKMAFMFLTKGPLPFAPLWERFFNGHQPLYSIYVHALPNYEQDFPSSSVFYGRYIPSQVVEWGKMSMCDAERRLLANALLDISNEWFVLLSEACIPLHNFSFIYNHISSSRYSFMGSVDEDGPYGRGRYHRGMEPEVTLSQWRKGSQWFEINRKLAIEIVQDTTYYPKFNDFCRPHQCYVDEHYFPTMLTMKYPRLLANRTLTWTDWTRGGAHPATFGKSDITGAFIRKLPESIACHFNDQSSKVCYLFARKFAPSALEPLLEISASAMGF